MSKPVSPTQKNETTDSTTVKKPKGDGPRSVVADEHVRPGQLNFASPLHVSYWLSETLCIIGGGGGGARFGMCNFLVLIEFHLPGSGTSSNSSSATQPWYKVLATVDLGADTVWSCSRQPNTRRRRNFLSPPRASPVLSHPPQGGGKGSKTPSANASADNLNVSGHHEDDEGEDDSGPEPGAAGAENGGNKAAERHVPYLEHYLCVSHPDALSLIHVTRKVVVAPSSAATNHDNNHKNSTAAQDAAPPSEVQWSLRRVCRVPLDTDTTNPDKKPVAFIHERREIFVVQDTPSVVHFHLRDLLLLGKESPPPPTISTSAASSKPLEPATTTHKAPPVAAQEKGSSVVPPKATLVTNDFKGRIRNLDGCPLTSSIHLILLCVLSEDKLVRFFIWDNEQKTVVKTLSTSLEGEGLISFKMFKSSLRLVNFISPSPVGPPPSSAASARTAQQTKSTAPAAPRDVTPTAPAVAEGEIDTKAKAVPTATATTATATTTTTTTTSKKAPPSAAPAKKSQPTATTTQTLVSVQHALVLVHDPNVNTSYILRVVILGDLQAIHWYVEGSVPKDALTDMCADGFFQTGRVILGSVEGNIYALQSSKVVSVAAATSRGVVAAMAKQKAVQGGGMQQHQLLQRLRHSISARVAANPAVVQRSIGPLEIKLVERGAHMVPISSLSRFPRGGLLVTTDIGQCAQVHRLAARRVKALQFGISQHSEFVLINSPEGRAAFPVLFEQGATGGMVTLSLWLFRLSLLAFIVVAVYFFLRLIGIGEGAPQQSVPEAPLVEF